MNIPAYNNKKSQVIGMEFINRHRGLILNLCIPLFVGLLSAFVVGDKFSIVYENVKESISAPPAYIFPIVWTIIYLLLGYATYLVVDSFVSEDQIRYALKINIIQLFLNFLWPILFFRYELPKVSLLVACLLWFVVILETVVYGRIKEKAAYLLLPYIAWMAYAVYLNLKFLLI